MAKEKLVKNITPRDENFAQWYTDVVREAELCDYSSVKGCLNYLPNGYAIWELIQADQDRRFKETGVENVSLPLLIPESLLEKESDHIDGFAPEVAWVTHGGMERLQERLCIRPTSETLFCDLWARTVKSYRDLPKVWNQWNSVLRCVNSMSFLPQEFSGTKERSCCLLPTKYAVPLVPYFRKITIRFYCSCPQVTE